MSRFLKKHRKQEGIVSFLVFSNTNTTLTDDLPVCDHEEADTRVIVHALRAAERGYGKIIIRTIDIIVIMLYHLPTLQTRYPNIKLVVSFGVGKSFQILDLEKIIGRLGSSCKGLPFFRAFTGCNSISAFRGRRKSTCWEAWRAYKGVSDAFSTVNDPP